MPTSHYFDKYPKFPGDIPTADVPIVSYRGLSQNSEDESLALLCACNTYGFFLLDFSGTPFGHEYLVAAEKMMDIGEAFFDLDHEEKSLYAWKPPTALFGYKKTGDLRVESGKPDRYEFYNMSTDEIRGVSARTKNPLLFETNRDKIASYLQQCDEVVKTIMSHLERRLGIHECSLMSVQDPSKPSGSALRFLKYPPQPHTDQRSSMVGHTDFGSITVLFSVVGGLQVLTKENEWLYVKPRPGCAVVNLGDAMVEWTGGVLRSNLHRVNFPPGRQADYTKYSLAYVVRPNAEVSMRRMHGGLIPTVKDGEDLNTLSAKEWEIEKTKGVQNGKDIGRGRGGMKIAVC